MYLESFERRIQQRTRLKFEVSSAREPRIMCVIVSHPVLQSVSVLLSVSGDVRYALANARAQLTLIPAPAFAVNLNYHLEGISQPCRVRLRQIIRYTPGMH